MYSSRQNSRRIGGDASRNNRRLLWLGLLCLVPTHVWSDTHIATPAPTVSPANAGSDSGLGQDSGGSGQGGQDVVVGTPGVGPTGPPTCAAVGVNFGTTTEDCKTLCGSGLANSGDTIDKPDPGEFDQGIYRVTWCTCNGEDLCRTKKLLVDPTQDIDCADLDITNSATCLQGCFPQGYEYNFNNGFFVCSCKILGEFEKKCDQLAPDGAAMMSLPLFDSWLYGILLFAGMLNLLR